MPQREYINASVKGVCEAGTDEVVLSLYGPKGGTKACEALTVEAATRLRDQLTEALLRFNIHP